jgi:hypothetical protein
MTGVFPCDLELDGRFVGPGELLWRTGLPTSVCGGTAAEGCFSPEDSDLGVFPDLLTSVS